MGGKVIDAKWCELDDVQFQADVRQRFHRPIDLVSLHCEQAHLSIQGEPVNLLPATHLLKVPDHFVQVERNLLLGFVPHDLGDLLGIHRRRLEEPCQTSLARHGHGDRRTFDVVLFDELRYRCFDQLFRVRFGLTENLGVFDIVERLRDDLAVLHRAIKRLERALPNIDSPNTLFLGHRFS